MASGVKVDNECKTVFLDIKLGRKYRYVLFGFTKEDDKQIVVLKKADPSATYESFTEDLYAAEKDKECRYAVYDAEYEGGGGIHRNKILFFMWSPDSATIKQKMLYASSKAELKRAFGEGVAKEIQATDHGELAWSSVLDNCKRTDRD